MAYGRPIAVRAGMGRPTRRRPSETFGTASPMLAQLPLSVAAAVARLASASLSAQINTSAGSEDPATYRYVTPAGAGAKNGTDWANAYQWSTFTPQRGLIYWLAGGTYAAKAVNTAPSGTSTITLRKASVAEHGTDTGWSNTFGTTQAVMGDLNPFCSYLNVDGRYKYGILANQWWHPINCTALRITNVEFGPDGAIDMTQFPATIGTGSNCYIANNWFHDTSPHTGDSPRISLFGTNAVVEFNECGPDNGIDFIRPFGSGHIIRDNYIHDCVESGGAHMDIVQIFGNNNWYGNNILVERNLCVNWEGQICNTSQDGVAQCTDLTFRNNVFAYFGQNMNIGMPNVSILNNTFFRCGMIYQVTGGPGQAFNGTNMVVKNNIIIGSSGDNADYDAYYDNPSGLSVTKQNNFYATTTGAALIGTAGWGETNSINGGTLGFVNAGTLASHAASALNFRLTAGSTAINKGQTLTGFSTDFDGVSRPQGAAWDCGAFEYVP